MRADQLDAAEQGRIDPDLELWRYAERMCQTGGDLRLCRCVQRNGGDQLQVSGVRGEQLALHRRQGGNVLHKALRQRGGDGW